MYIQRGRGNRFGNKQDNNANNNERDHYAQSNTHDRHVSYVKKDLKRMGNRFMYEVNKQINLTFTNHYDLFCDPSLIPLNLPHIRAHWK